MNTTIARRPAGGPLPLLSAGLRRDLAVVRQARLSRLIVVAGMPYAGIDLLAAIACACLRSRAEHQVWCGWARELPQAPCGGILVLKSQEVSAVLALRASAVLYATRDVREVLAHLQQDHGVLPSLELRSQYLREEEQARRCRAELFAYKDFSARLEPAVEHVARALAVPVDCGRVLRELRDPATAGAHAGAASGRFTAN